MRLGLAAVICTLVAAGCQPEDSGKPFHLPDTFTYESTVVPAAPCTTAVDWVNEEEPGSDEWRIRADQALDFSAIQSLVTHRDVAEAVRGERDEDNPWELAPANLEFLTDGSTWAALCEAETFDPELRHRVLDAVEDVNQSRALYNTVLAVNVDNYPSRNR